MSIIIRNVEYEILKTLGKGGFGRVIQVKNKSDEKLYAIKEIIIKDEIEENIENIKKEAGILSIFSCNNIVKFYDSYLDKDKFYILMEYCDGQNLRDYIDINIKNNELIEENILYNIIKQICIGIKEIHNKNIIHRDIKPENIFMNEKNDIKIGDFGISKYFGSNKDYTRTVKQGGSLYYTAPEILIRGIYNEKADMYSLGCIIYELFNLSRYYDDKENEEKKKIDYNIYNKKWQEIINSLLQINYNNRMDINKVCDIILNEIKIKVYKMKIKTWKGETIILDVKDHNYYIGEIKKIIREKSNIETYNQELTFNGIHLKNNYKLSDYPIQDNSTLYLSFKENKEMEIFIRTLTNKTITIYAKPTDYLSDVKLKIKDKDKEGIPPDDYLKIIYGTRLLYGNKTLDSYYIEEFSTLILDWRLIGG